MCTNCMTIYTLYKIWLLYNNLYYEPDTVASLDWQNNDKGWVYIVIIFSNHLRCVALSLFITLHVLHGDDIKLSQMIIIGSGLVLLAQTLGSRKWLLPQPAAAITMRAARCSLFRFEVTWQQAKSLAKSCKITSFKSKLTNSEWKQTIHNLSFTNVCSVYEELYV